MNVQKKRERNSHMRWYVLMSNVKTATKLGRRGRFSRNHNNYGSATPEEEGKINVGSLISLSQSQARARMSERLKHREPTHTCTHTHTHHNPKDPMKRDVLIKPIYCFTTPIPYTLYLW